MITIPDDVIDRAAYERDGFVVLQVLDDQEIGRFLAEAEKLIAPDPNAKKADRGSSDARGDETAQVNKSDDKKPAANKHHKAKKTKSGEPKESHVYLMKDIVINPAGTGGTRFLSVSFGFELESLELMRMFEGREPIIRDALITILSSKTVAQLTDFKQKEIMLPVLLSFSQTKSYRIVWQCWRCKSRYVRCVQRSFL